MHYLYLVAAVILFGTHFRFNQIYERESGAGMRASCVFIALSSLAGLVVLLFLNGPSFSVTPFALLLAGLSAVDGVAYSVFSIKAFGRVNLSLYSVFAMLGGMLLPTLTGLVFFHESLTLLKGLGLAVLLAAVLVPLAGTGDRKGLGYCFAVFCFNGLYGVFATLFEKLPYDKPTAAQYSILCAALTAAVAALMLPFLKKERVPLNAKSIAALAGYGVFNRVGNYLVLLALTVLPASVQSPFVTGGVIIVSFLIGLVTKQKPAKAEYVSAAASLAGLVLLIFA